MNTVNFLIEKSIRHRFFALSLVLLIGVLSYYSIKNIQVDAIPDIGENQQIVFSQWPGRSPKDVDQQITYPLSVHLQGIAGVKSIRGLSAFGFSSIFVIFDENQDFYDSRARILEKLSSLQNVLPEGVKPGLGPDASGLGQVFAYTLENHPDSKKPKSLAELRSIQDFFVKFMLQSAKGVSEVASVGGFVKEYQIDVDPKKIFAFDIHFTALVMAIEKSNLDVGAEVIHQGGKEFVIRGKGFFKSIEDIENVVVAVKNGVPIRVKDLAKVGNGPAFRRGALDKNGMETVGGIVTMRYGENPRTVIEGIKKRIEEISIGLPPGVLIVPFYDRTEIIENSMATVFDALSKELLITVLVVFVFLLNFHSSFLVSLTLLLGLGISFIFMKIFKIQSNIMSLSGLVIAIGAMVDMGIIMVENILTPLREKNNKEDILKSIIGSAKELGPAVLTASLTTIVSFLPVFGLSETEAKLFHPLAISKTLAMLGAVLTAIFLLPPLCTFVFGLQKGQAPKKESFLQRFYGYSLRKCLNFPYLFLLLPLVFCVFGFYSFDRLGKEFMPKLNEGDILYMPVTSTEVNITKARELLSYTDKIIKRHPLVEFSVGKLGRSDSALDPAPVSMFETHIKLKDKTLWPKNTDIYQVMDELDQSLQIPGLINSWDFPIQTRVGMISTGIKTQLGLKIFGDDHTKLEALAKQAGEVLKTIPGATSVYPERFSDKTYLEFEVNRVLAARFGINSFEINQILQTAVGGMAIGDFYEGRRRFPIRVRYKKEFRNEIEQLKQVLIPSPLGKHIPLSQLAKISVKKGPSHLKSENGLLKSQVLLNVKNRDFVSFIEEAKKLLAENLELPPGYAMLWSGEFENEVRSKKSLSLLIPFALVLIICLLYFLLGSLRDSFTVFSAVPVAFSGGAILLYLGDFNSSVAVWVGFIALFGIAIDDGIILMTYLKKELDKKRPVSQKELFLAIERAGKRRIKPLLMTTSTTACALLPVMFSTGIGSEIIKPMAIPTLGGIVAQSFSLFMVPILFSFFNNPKKNKV